MSASFYSKEGLDFLYFNRPGTIYNKTNGFFDSKMIGTDTK
jgi:hypothetical protein